MAINTALLEFDTEEWNFIWRDNTRRYIKELHLRRRLFSTYWRWGTKV